MYKVILAGFWLLMQLFTSVSTQDDNYQLREPSPSEYAQILINHLWEISDGGSRYDTVSALSPAALHLFGANDKTIFADLYQMYQRLNIGYLDGAYRREWNVLLVQRWLAENQPDLNKIAELELAPEFTINVTPRDFNADGVDEYVLNIHNVDTVHMYLVVAVDNGRYRIIDPDLPWTGYTPWGRFSEGDGEIEEYDYLDLNVDGLPEWVILYSGDTSGGPGWGYFDAGALFILGWRNGSLQFLSPSWLNRTKDYKPELVFEEDQYLGKGPLTVHWSFTNLDTDSALEINQFQSYTDNWNCHRVETMRFNWDASADMYLYQDTTVAYDRDTQSCLQRLAEEAMWGGDYVTAVDLFDKALTHPTIVSESVSLPELAQTQNQYLRARLAMAYLFTNQPEPAATLLDELKKEKFSDEAIAAYVNVLYDQKDTDLATLCSAAFNVFAQNFPSIVIGGTTDHPYYDGPAYDPARVGCDAPTLVRERLDAGIIPVSLSPLDWLQNNDVGITKAFSADLNQDGDDEVLVWTNVPGVQILFVPSDETYTTSFVTLDPYLYASELDTWLLPGAAGVGIATIDTDYVGAYLQQKPWPPAYDNWGGAGGGGPVPQCLTAEGAKNANTVQLWRLDGTILANILRISTCADTVATALGTGGQHSISTTDQVYEYIPDEGEVLKQYTSIYIWDETERQYIWQRPATPTPQAEFVPKPTVTPEAATQRPYYSASQAFADNAYTVVLDMTPTVLNLATDEDVDTMLAEMYLRALSLEALGQEDSALTLFISLQAAAPEHIVGKLAMLHYEAKVGS